MESKRKKMEVNASSLVELKAELFRKEEELRQKKLNKVSANVKASKPLTNKKGFSWSKKNAASVEKAQEELAEKIEEVDAFDKAKKALAAKASLYEKLTKGDFVPEEDGSQLYLVDFQQKAIVTIADKRHKRLGEGQGGKSTVGEKEDKEVAEKKSLSADDDSAHHASCPDEEWVDYVDSLGRTRRCMKKDLASLEEMDRELSGKREKPTVSEDKMDLMSSDMKRELEREQWEKEAQMELEGPSGPLHYSNVQFNEVRDHGVGFFGFAKDEETRQQQLDALKELRSQTRSQREKHDKLKEKRKHMLNARLEKVKQRRIVKDAVANFDLDPMTFAGEGEEREPEPIKEPELIVRDDSWRKNAPVREWDKDKKQIFDQESWLEKQREERLQDFAPPVLLYEQQQKMMSSQFKRTKLIHHAQPSLKKTLVTSVGEQATRATPFGEKLSGFEPNTTNDRTCVSSPCSVTLEVQPPTDQAAGTDGNRPASDDVSEIPLPSTDNLERNSTTCLPTPEHGSSVSSSTFTSFPPGHFQPYMQPGGYYWDRTGESLESTTSVVDQEHHVPPWGVVDSSFTQSTGQQQMVGLSQECGPATEDQIQSVRTEHVEPQLGETLTGYVAPQPAHYSNAPMKPQPRGPKYHTVNVHEIPLTLPEPPSANFVPHYPSQEEVIALKKAAKGEKSEQANIKDWYRQFDQIHRAPSGVDKMSKLPMKPPNAATLLRPSTIPFASRYIQRKDGQSTEDSAAAIFDPAKPPPTLNSQ